MTITLSFWGWCAVGGVTLLLFLLTAGCNWAAGHQAGEDYMRRAAIRAGVARACDFDGGWRFWTREEVAQQEAERRLLRAESAVRIMREAVRAGTAEAHVGDP